MHALYLKERPTYTKRRLPGDFGTCTDSAATGVEVQRLAPLAAVVAGEGGTDSPAVAHGQPLVALVEDGVPEVVVAPVVLALRITEHLNVLLVLPRHPSQRRDAVVDLLTNTRTRQVSKRCLAPHV